VKKLENWSIFDEVIRCTKSVPILGPSCMTNASISGQIAFRGFSSMYAVLHTHKNVHRAVLNKFVSLGNQLFAVNYVDIVSPEARFSAPNAAIMPLSHLCGSSRSCLCGSTAAENRKLAVTKTVKEPY